MSGSEEAGVSVTHGAQTDPAEPPRLANKLTTSMAGGLHVLRFSYEHTPGGQPVDLTPVAIPDKLFRELEEFFVQLRARREAAG